LKVGVFSGGGSRPNRWGKANGGWQNGLIAGIVGGAEEEDGGDAADDLNGVREFAVAEPLCTTTITGAERMQRSNKDCTCPRFVHHG
jgi:hypothetical protein